MTSPVAAVLRAADPADLRPIAELHVRAWRAAYRGLLPQELLDNLSVDAREAMWTRRLAEPAVSITVADRSGVIGFVASGPSRDDDATAEVGAIYALYLEPDHIGTGLGRALLEHATDELRARGFTCATLWALASNDRARRFYERAGYGFNGFSKTVVRDEVAYDDVRHQRWLVDDPPIARGGDPGGSR